MRKTRKLLSLCIVDFSIVSITVFLCLSSVTAQIAGKFDNLQLVPKNISRGELLNLMKDMTFALGTRCWYCHEGEGDDLSSFDFASDKKPTKEVTRTMMKMVEAINTKFIAQVEDDAKVTCFTCHRGQIEPEE